MKGKKKLAVAMTAMSIAAVGSAAAQAQSTEVLQGTTRTTSGGWSCYGLGNLQHRSALVEFTGAGTAAGPYPGSFSEYGTASLHSVYGPLGTGYLSTGFSITSDKTTITGTLMRSPLLGGVFCGGSIAFGGSVNIGTYRGTLSGPGKLQLISGAAAVSGAYLPRRVVRAGLLSH